MMSDRTIPPALRAAADNLFSCVTAMIEYTATETVVSHVGEFRSSESTKNAEAGLCRRYFALCENPNEANYRDFHLTASAYHNELGKAPVETQSAAESVRWTGPVQSWHGKWAVFNQLWQTWSSESERNSASTATPKILSVGSWAEGDKILLPSGQNRMLTSDQQIAIDRLLALSCARWQANEVNLPSTLLARWSFPLLVGPSGSGKAFVCEEIARRWEGRPYRRWEIGSWTTRTSYAGNKTLDEIYRYIKESPHGCVIYLASLDKLAVSGERGMSHHHATVSELMQFLDWSSRRCPRFVVPSGSAPAPPFLVVLGTQFSILWGSRKAVGVVVGDAWKNTDDEPPSSPAAVAAWLAEHSGLPAELLQRLAAEPLMVRYPSLDEAERLAVGFHKLLPPSLDGIGAQELTDAFRKPQGWLAVSGVIEAAFVSGYENLPAPTNDYTAENAKIKSQLVSLKVPKKARISRQAHKLRLPVRESVLLAKAKQFGLDTPAMLETLACARGYLLPNERTNLALTFFDVRREEFSDVELMVALLCPYQKYSEQAICRGALMLRSLLASVESPTIVSEARKEQAELVVRHIAMLGYQLGPQKSVWTDILIQLPLVGRNEPGFAENAMPDDEILAVFRSLDGA